MSDYGLRIKDAAGNILLNITDRITRFRYAVEVASGVSSSVVLSDIADVNTVEVSIPTESAVSKAGHGVSRSGTTISWTEQSGVPGPYTSAASLVFVFIYT